MSKIRDTDYLTISARVRAMENRLVTRERMERMVEARSDDEAVKVLAECGYEELPALTNRGLDELLSAARAALYRELGGAVPDKRLVELFQMKYDYHNAKALVKGAAVGADADRLLMEGGRWSAAQVKEAFQRDSLREFTGPFRRAVEVNVSKHIFTFACSPPLKVPMGCIACLLEIPQRAKCLRTSFVTIAG